jgi:pimeloyl-ACP methyl ester carboxylesterase
MNKIILVNDKGVHANVYNADGKDGTVFFIHGMSTYLDAYKKLFDMIPTYQIIGIDLVGHGLSFGPPGTINCTKQINTVTYILDNLNLIDESFSNIKCNDIILMGHSYGGLISSLLTQKYEFKKTILLNPSLFLSDNSLDFFKLSGKIFYSIPTFVFNTIDYIFSFIPTVLVLYNTVDPSLFTYTNNVQNTINHNNDVNITRFMPASDIFTIIVGQYQSLNNIKNFKNKIIMILGDNDKLLNNEMIKNAYGGYANIKTLQNMGHEMYNEVDVSLFKKELLDSLKQ